MKKIIFIITVLVAVLIITISKYSNFNNKDLTASKVVNSINKIDSSVREKVFAQDDDIASEKKVSQRKKINKEIVQLQKMTPYFNAKMLENEFVMNLDNYSEVLENSKNIILDYDEMIEIYGEDQAKARVYAIKILKIAARNGDTEPLKSTTQLLAQQLSQIEWQEVSDKKRNYDLEDLIRAYVEVTTKRNDIEHQIEYLMEVTGFNRSLNADLKDIYDDLFFAKLAPEIGREKASKILAQLID